MAGINHSHLEVLQRTPPNTREGEFITVGLGGDVGFMPFEDFWQVIEYCRKWKDRTFMIQSKNPAFFLRHVRIPDNLILSTTIETNYDQIPDTMRGGVYQYDYYISKAPLPEKRYEAMLKLDSRKAITIEPILSFHEDIMMQWIQDIKPEFVYVGYNSKNKLNLPEPLLSDTLNFINRLRSCGIEVREKLLRKAFYE